MVETALLKVVIVDYGLGNLFSVKHACEHVGLHALVSSAKSDLLTADAVILPGVGAFGDAMENLKRLDLISPLKDIATSGKPLIGICLGLQLFMTESYEFGQHKGLGLIEGVVMRFENPIGPTGSLKVPQIGWNNIYPSFSQGNSNSWQDTPLTGLQAGEFMYFVHSYYVKPKESEVVLSTTRYGNINFCSSLHRGNLFASQFHPERSGSAGMQIYRQLTAFIGQQNYLKEN